MPKISVVMPTFNQGKFIRYAIHSILTQTFQDWELIIVDDGSPDDTMAIANSFVELDARIKYIRKSNGGTGSALNDGFRMATGKYETWFASDNVLEPDAFQVMNDYLDATPDIDYVYASCDICVMDNTGGNVIERRNIQVEVDQKWDSEKLNAHYFLGIVWLWRKELREKAGEFQLEPCEDYDMVLKMRDIGGRFAFIDKNLGWFRRHSENMTNRIIKHGISKGDPHFYSHFVQEKSRLRRGAAC